MKRTLKTTLLIVAMAFSFTSASKDFEEKILGLPDELKSPRLTAEHHGDFKLSTVAKRLQNSSSKTLMTNKLKPLIEIDTFLKLKTDPTPTDSKFIKYMSLVERYGQANGFEKKRVMKEIEAFATEIPEQDVSPLAGKTFLVKAGDVEYSAPFDFDNMSKAVQMLNASCRSLGLWSDSGLNGNERLQKMINRNIALVHGEYGLKQSYGGKKRNCFVELVFDNEGLAEKVEEVTHSGNLTLFIEFEVAGSVIDEHMIAVARNLIVTESEVIKGKGRGSVQYNYLTHYAEPKSVSEKLNANMFVENNALSTLNASDVPVDEKTIGAWNAEWNSDTAVFPLHGKDLSILDDSDFFIRKTDNTSFMIMSYTGDWEHGAIGKYEIDKSGKFALLTQLYSTGYSLPERLLVFANFYDNKVSEALLYGFDSRLQIRANKPYKMDSWENIAAELGYTEGALKPYVNSLPTAALK
jgi:hypothetical protein